MNMQEIEKSGKNVGRKKKLLTLTKKILIKSFTV